MRNWGQYSSTAVLLARKKYTFHVKLIETIVERPIKKNIESLDLTRKVSFLRHWRGKRQSATLNPQFKIAWLKIVEENWAWLQKE